MPGLNDFLSRIQTDHTFYLQVKKDPEGALAAYELSAEEQAAFTESGPQLWAYLGRLTTRAESLARDQDGSIVHDPNPTNWKISPLHTSTNAIADLCGSADSDFNPATLLSRPEVQQTIALIHGASTHAGKAAAVSALMEQIG